MKIAVFSDNKTIDQYFKKIKTNKQYTVEYYETKNLKKILKNYDQASLVYLDIEKFSKENLNKTINFLSKQIFYRYIIIDLKNKINDIAEVFHKNAADYINDKTYKDGLTLKRIKSILSFKEIKEEELPLVNKSNGHKDIIISGKDWKDVKNGKEYTFCFMYIQFDNYKELKTECGSAYANKMLTSFQDYLAKIIAPLHGKLWMWMESTGLIIFPFDGKNCPSILSCFKLILNRRLISVEQEFKLLLSYRIALHIGNTIYKSRGNTGTIVSESINSIFHLGQKFTKTGRFVLTEEVAQYIPKQIEKYFKPAGEFENRNIIQMKKLL